MAGNGFKFRASHSCGARGENALSMDIVKMNTNIRLSIIKPDLDRNVNLFYSETKKKNLFI